MGHFLDIAYRVLTEEGEPLSAREITRRALDRGWLRTGGKTPWQTMKSKLSTEILCNKDRSPFMRTEQGTFALRSWTLREVNEYIADRYQKALLEEEVVVFPASSLSRYISGRGLFTNFTAGTSLLRECRPMPRRIAEDDPTVIQLVSAFLVRHNDRYLTYKRTKRLPESRLHGYYSMIFGGHLNPDDIPPLFNIFDPHDGAAFITRELNEEIKFPRTGVPEISYRGLLYDDSRALSQQHLGIVYDVEVKSAFFEIGERGFLIDAKFETLKEIASRREDFENWSTLLLDYELNRVIASAS